MKRFQLRDGYEVRGLMVRLYPDSEQESALKIIESDLRIRWNWFVKQVQGVIDARQAYAVKNGLVPPRPAKPDCDGMGPKETKATWEWYHDACSRWHSDVHAATDKLPCCAWRPSFSEEVKRFGFKYDYQFFASEILPHPSEEIRPCAHAYQALVKNYFTKGGRRKKFRRASDPMPLQVRSGCCFELGEFGMRGKDQRPFYNCQVKFNGMKIRGRLPGRAPWGRVLEGVSITKQADGWWASIKQEIPKRILPTPIPGSVIGIDAGLDAIAAFSDGTVVENPREKEYSERIAGRQALKKDTGRIQQKYSRHVRHLLYNKVVKPLAVVETIKVEKLNGRIGQMGSCKTSSMRTMVQMLVDRYGERVQEVNPAYTSQDCSNCGHRDKEAWGYGEGKVKTCPACGYRQHRDVNAAINIANRPTIASGEAMTEIQESLATQKHTTEQAESDKAAE